MILEKQMPERFIILAFNKARKDGEGCGISWTIHTNNIHRAPLLQTIMPGLHHSTVMPKQQTQSTEETI